MPFVLILVGVVLLVVAIRDTYGSLGAALSTDVGGFAPWALALAGVGALGFVPGLRTPARWMLLLVMAVLVLKNYQAILTGFSGATSTADATTPPATPSQAYAANPQAAIPVADVAGVGSTATGASSTSTALASAAAPYDPNGVVTGFLQQAGVSAIFDAAGMGFGAVG